jgi:hypothetical protein
MIYKYLSLSINKSQRGGALGSSLAVRLPRDIVKSMGLKEKDKGDIYSTRGGTLLKPKEVKIQILSPLP